MSEVTRLLSSLQPADSKVGEQLLSLVYDELRRLAAQKLARELPGQTLQPTALVHEAWLRLVDHDQPLVFQNRAYFFGAAAEAMQRILIERARRRKTLEKGGYVEREECTESKIIQAAPTEELLAVHEALDGLTVEDSTAADLVKLRYFVGMSMPEAANALGIPLRSAERVWTFAKAWLRNALAI